MDRYFIGLTLPDAFSKQVDQWRIKFDPTQAYRHPPHLTLHRPFNYDDINNLIFRLQELLANFPQIELQPVQIEKFFDQKRHHLEISQTPSLRTLYEQINNLTGIKSQYLFNPHITVGHLNSTQLKKASLELTDKTVLAKGVAVFKLSNDRWDIYWQKLLDQNIDSKIG